MRASMKDHTDLVLLKHIWDSIGIGGGSVSFLLLSAEKTFYCGCRFLNVFMHCILHFMLCAQMGSKLHIILFFCALQ